jgi:ubiquitin-activating enzyme E1
MAAPVDEDLHSRQLAVYGREAMSSIGTAKILISGMNGVGIEIGANAQLAAACRSP